jgi:hypothetical protein
MILEPRSIGKTIMIFCGIAIVITLIYAAITAPVNTPWYKTGTFTLRTLGEELRDCKYINRFECECAGRRVHRSSLDTPWVMVQEK